MRHALLLLGPMVALVVACAGDAPSRPVDRTISTPAAVEATSAAAVHVVRPGDTLSRIAAEYGVTVEELGAANAIVDPSSLAVGQELVVPGGPPAAAPADTPPEGAAPVEVAPTPEPAPTHLQLAYQESSEIAAPRGTVPLDYVPYEAPRSLVDRATDTVVGWVAKGWALPGGPVLVAIGGVALALVVVQMLAMIAYDLRVWAASAVPAAGRRAWYGLREAGLTVWYAAWWAGLAVWMPARWVWLRVAPWAEPRARQWGEISRERAAIWSARGADYAKERGKLIALRARDEAFDNLEELALRKPGLRGFVRRAQEFAYRESRVLRSRRTTEVVEVWPPTEAALLEALEARKMTIEFRPVMNVEKGCLIGLDATIQLLRDGAAPVLESRLMAAVERPGQTRLQRALLERALRDATELLVATGSDAPAPSVCVPVARTQFFDPMLFSALRNALRDSGVAHERIEIGIEERSVLSDLEAAAEVMGRLRELGVRTVLRGFGSLTGDQLKALGVAAVTVNFWGSRRDEGAEVFVRDSVRVARAAGVPVTATGAETPDEAELVRELKCDRVTGESAGTPLPASAFTSGQPSEAAATAEALQPSEATPAA